MQRPIKPEWLIRQAGALAGSGRGQPVNADLRRATSAAYYGLFHQLALDAAMHLLPAASVDDARRAARSITHASVKQVCGWVAGQQPKETVEELVGRLRQDPGLATISAAFVKLYDEREAADYDHFADFTRPGTKGLIAQAEDAVRLLRARADDDVVRSFLGLIVLVLRPRSS